MVSKVQAKVQALNSQPVCNSNTFLKLSSISHIYITFSTLFNLVASGPKSTTIFFPAKSKKASCTEKWANEFRTVSSTKN